MFAKLYKKTRQMWGKLPAFAALTALLTSGLVAIEPLPAEAAIVTNNLVMNLDGTDTSSLPATGNWSSIAPGTGTFSGTVNGATRTPAGGIGGLTFDGFQDYVNFGTNSGAITGSMTFETWYKPGNQIANNWNILASRWFDSPTTETSANHDFHFGIFHDGTSAKLRLDTSTQTGTLIGNTVFPNTSANKWYLLGFVIDSATGKAQLFVNGVADSAQATMSHNASTGPQFWIGDGRTGTAYLSPLGQISKVHMYGAALTSAQIGQNYTADAALYGAPPKNTVVPNTGGKGKIGSALSTTDGTWIGDSSATTAYKWQTSADNVTFADITGATSSSYTPVSADGGNYVRAVVTKSTSAGSTSANSTSIRVATAGESVIANDGKIPGLTSTVPNDATLYNVTLYSPDLTSKFKLGTTTGLTAITGYSVPSTLMASAITDQASIISFRGTGIDVNNALNNVTLNGTLGTYPVIKLYYAQADSGATGIRNYIPILDNGNQLTFHYYIVKSEASPGTLSRAQLDTKLATLGTSDGVQATRWYAATTRYQIEWQRIKDLAGSLGSIHWGAYAYSSSSNWYWPANTDGYSASTQFSVGSTGSNTLFNGTSTVQPWASGEPNAPTNTDRSGNLYTPGGSVLSWDDTPVGTQLANWSAETYATTPVNTGIVGNYTATVHLANLAAAPTGLTASAPATSVTLNWTAPAAVTDPITDYVIQYSSDGMAWTNWSHTGSTDTTATVTGLTASTVYQFRVAAFTTDTGAFSQSVMSAAATTTGAFKSLSGYVIPTTTTGTMRVLLVSSNSSGRLWFTNTTNIDGGIRGTANYPDNNAWTPINNYQPAGINSAGQMVGLVDTSASEINTALASLKYQSPSASTDTITMYLSNGTEYVAILNGTTPEFHYYGTVTNNNQSWATVRGTGYAGAARTIDGVSLAAGTPFLATPRYRAENMYVMALGGTTNLWLNASDDTAAPASSTEGTWKWFGPDANGVQFWNGGTSGSVTNNEYSDWNFNSSNSLIEPNGGTGENCLDTNGGGSSTGPIAAWGWNDNSCTSLYGYVWEAYNSGAPLGSNSSNAAAANFASVSTKQTVTISAPPAAPTALNVGSTASGQVELSWTAPAGVSGITSYSVQYSTNGVNWTEDRNSASTATTETVTGLSPNTFYQFRVAALTASATGIFTYGYFSPTGTGKWLTTTSMTNTVTGLSVPASLNTYKMSVLLRVSNSTVQLGTITNLGGIRGTANYGSLGTAGQMIGLTGLGSDINTALASLKYIAPSTSGNQAISMWVSTGTTSALPQSYVPIYNSISGQVEFHYYGVGVSPGPWTLAQSKADANTDSINGVTVASGKYLATAESADQAGAVADAIAAYGTTGVYWLNGGDFNTVSPNNPDGDWYWLGPDTGVSKFWTGLAAGSAVNGSYYSWGAASATAKQEPNGGPIANCLVGSSAAWYGFASTPSGIVVPGTVGISSIDDMSCYDTTKNYVWEYIANTPVGSSVSGANYQTVSARAVTVGNNAEAPVLTTAVAGKTGIVLDWEVPTVNAATGITNYTVDYSTSSTFATTTGSFTTTDTSFLVPNLTASTQYYFRVKANGLVWSGVYSNIATATTASTNATISIVASGGGVSGTDWVNLDGNFYSKTGGAVSINVSDITTSLATANTSIAADVVNINTALTWSANKTLTFGTATTGTLAVNDNITASGTTAGIVIAPASYSLDVKNKDEIILSGDSSTLSIGGNSYTLIRSISDLSTVATSGRYALAKPLSFSAALTASPINVSFGGTFDGLGNTFDAMTITVPVNSFTGLFSTLGTGATVRNLGVTNAKLTLPANATASAYAAAGVIAGGVADGTTGTVAMSNVWTTGFITGQSGSLQNVGVAGLVAWVRSGTLNVSKSWSGVNIDTTALAATALMAGGLIGADSRNFGQGNTEIGANLSLSEVYTTGNIKTLASGWRGAGGLVGLHYSSGTISISDAFTWGTILPVTYVTNYGGAVGVGDGSGTATYARIYVANSTCGTNTPAGMCTVSQTPGSTVSGISGAAWTTANGTTLANVQTPTRPIYVQVIANTDTTAATVTHRYVDGSGTVLTDANLTTMGVSITGTPVYSVTSSTPISATAYSTYYVSGLTLGGSNAALYSLGPWRDNTNVTISKYTQNITWSPTLIINWGSGTFTPDATPTGLGSPSFSYSLSNVGTTGCTVNSSTGVVSYTNAGTCAITVTATATDYLTATKTVSFVINNSPTFTIVASGGGTQGTDYTLSGGRITAAAGASVNINASDLTTALAAGSITLVGNVVVNAPISWTANTTLTLGSAATNTVAINDNITVSGTTGGLVIAPATYGLNIKDAKSIQLPGASTTLSIGGNSYTLIRSTAGISTITATAGNKYALAMPVSYSTTYSRSILDLNFAGTLDGLGNTVDNYKVTYTGTSTVVNGIGFFKGLAGGTIRNLGITNELIYMNSTNSADMAVGGLVGESTGGTLEQVWTQGLIYVRTGATYTNYSGGGLVGKNTSGTLTVNKSYSATSVSAYFGTFTNVYVGGLIGSNLGAWDATSATASGSVVVSEAYATGDLSQQLLTGNHSMGGILGTHRGTGSVNISDVFTWTNQLAGTGETNWGGVAGFTSGGSTTINNTWTYNSQSIPNITLTPAVTLTNSSWNFANYFSTAQTYPAVGAKWYNSANGRQLVNLPMAYKYVYVRPGTNPDGSYGSLTYVLTNGNTTTLTASNLGLTLSGTATYTIDANTAVSTTPYVVGYVSGLTLGGTNAFGYTLKPLPLTYSITISKLPQTLTWDPTVSVAFGSGTITPSALPVASGGTAITYAVTNAGSTGCTVDSSTGVITATAGGSCEVTATAANAGNYLAATKAVTFVIGDAAATPTNVTATSGGTNGAIVSWTPGSVASSVDSTNFEIMYSTSSSMTSPTTVTSINSSMFVANLAAGTTYYFKVRAVSGSTWNGVWSSAASVTTAATNTSVLTIAATGGTAGTTWKNAAGTIYPVGSGIINAADLSALLEAGSITIAADTINVNADIAWTTQQRLNLGYSSTNSVNINALINSSGAFATINIAPASYNLSVKAGGRIQISGASASLTMGGTSYTLVRSIADLTAITATGNYAIATPINYSTPLTDSSAITPTFTGKLDGLGNTVSGLGITLTTGNTSNGFIRAINGATVRNLGITNFTGKINSLTGNVNLGAVIGLSAGGTIEQVWSSGSITATAGATIGGVGIGGLLGDANNGTTYINKSWSSLNVDTSLVTGLTNQMVGGLVGGDVAGYAQNNGGSGGSITMNQVYATGNLNTYASSTWWGTGGLLGLHYSTSSISITDAFSWSRFEGTSTFGGVIGVTGGGSTTLNRVYTVRSPLALNAITSTTSAYVSQTPGVAVTGLTGSNWGTENGSTLINLPTPAIPIYAKVVAPTDGSYATVGYSWVDVAGTAKTLSALSLTVSGTPVYSIASNVANGTYNTTYKSGLTLGGTNASKYEIYPWTTATSVAITKQAQTLSFTSTAPVNAKVSNTYTVAASATSSLTPTYAIDASTSSNCSINGAVVTFNAVGDCKVNANQAGSAGYTAAAQIQQTIAVGKGSQTITFTTTAPTNAEYNGTAYAVAAVGSTTSGSSVVISIDASSSTVCEIASGSVTFKGLGTCTVNANQAGTANYDAAAQVQQSFTVDKASQVFTNVSTVPSAAAVGGATYTVAATGGASGNAVTFAIDSAASAVCSITGTTVSFQTPGTCLVNINQAGTSLYYSATQLQQSFTVSKGSQVLAFTSNAPNAAKVGAANYTVTASGGASTSSVVLTVDSSATSKCSVSGMVVTYLAVGDCVLNLNQAGDSNYNAATQVQQTVTITADGRCPNGVVSGNYCLIRFNSSGTWTVPAGVNSVDMLAVGGGGAGGGSASNRIGGGGGGGGEVIENLATVVIPGTKFTINVGAGGIGSGAALAAAASTEGSASSISAPGFTTVNARGGGQGGTYDFTNNVPRNGGGGATLAGGGGGAAQSSNTAGLFATPGTGGLTNGGSAMFHVSDGNQQTAGGGGGAGGNGGNGTTTAAGAGGTGKNSVILGTLLGGGGGGGKRQATSGTAGTATAGGGAGGLGAAGTAGTANTGGGGGGSGGLNNNGANGGSGVVVIRIALTSQTIAFTSTAPTGLAYGTATTYTPTVSGTASEASPVITVDASSSAVCSIAAGVVSIIGAGTCTLNANQAGNGFYAPATQVQQSFSVAKQNQTLSFTSTAPTNAVVDGNTYTVAGTSTSGGSVAFSIAPGSSNVCTITAEVVTFRGAGTCTVLANQAGSTNWNGATQISQTINVGKGAQAINFTSAIPINAVVGGSTYTVTATGGASDNARVFASTTTAVCTIAGNVVTFLASGSCEITANQAGNDDYLAAPEVTQTIAVGAGTQAINFTSTIPTNAVVGGSPYSVSATGGASGQPVTFSVTSTTICSISAGVVTFLAAGDCVVEANQAGTANWNAATAATQTITVGKGTQVILFTSTAPTNAVVDGSTYTVTAAGGQSGKSVVISVSSPSVCSIHNGVVSFLTAGDCVVAANQDGNVDWNAANEITQTITVGKGAQVVAFSSAAPTGVRVDDAAYTPTATGGASTSAVTISIEASSSVICEINNGEVSFHAVGSCVLELNQAGDSNYVAAAQVTQTITVAKGLQTITKTSTDPIDAVVAGATYAPTFTGGASGSAVAVAISSATAARCEIVNGTISFISAGDCDVVVNQAGKSNYEAAPELTFTISVGKGSQVISWTSSAPTNAVVGGTTYTPTATGGATGNNVSFRVDSNTASVCAMSMGVVRFVGVGTCTVLANQAGNANYLAAAQESQTFTVGQGIQSINFTSAIPTAVVDGASYTPVATGGATGIAVTFSIATGSSSVCTLAFGRVTFQNVGTCDVEANQLGNTNYNAAAQVVQSITVGKGAQVVAFTSAAPSAKVGGTTYEPVVSGGASGNAVTLSIAPASSSICSVNNGVVSYQAVGSCVVQANQATSANYEAAAQVTQTITVAKGVQVLNFTTTPPSLRPVQGTTYVPAVTYGNSGEPVVFTIGAEAASICAISNGTISFLAVGDCVLYADQAGNANYTAATRISQIFDITKGEQIVTITSPAPTLAVVDGATYTPTGTGGAGTKPTVFTATAESAGICSVLEGIVYFDGAGDCVIALNQAGDTNYNAATQKLQNISVGKGTQTITFSSTNTTATVDGATYTPTYTDGEGINPVRISVLGSSSLICEVNAGVVSFHAVGDCVIEATQAGDNNYEAAQQVSQTITVAKGNQATLVGHSSLSSLTLGNSTPTAVLSTTGGSGIGSVSWSVTPETAAYCSVTGDVVSGLASGYCDLVATKLGDDNYLDATATLSVVVSTGGQTPVRTSINETSPTFSEGKTLTLALAGGDGDGAIWFESLTTHVCNTNGGTTLNIYHSGTCTVIGHKDGDDNYEAVANTLSFEIAKATQVGVTIHIAQALTYSPDGAVSAALSLEGVLASGTQSFSVTSGSCTIVDGALSATEAGDCEVTASILGDDKYLDGTFSHTFTIAKAAQAAVTATLATNAPPAIAWNGTKVTTFNIAGGSGPVSLTANTTTTSICSVAIEGSVVTVTGIARGTCEASVSNAASANYLVASKLFSVEVLDLASAPTSVAATTPARNNGAITSTISWVAPVSAATRATVTGYKVQSRIGTSEWTDVANGTVDVSSTSLSVTLEPWSKYNFRVAATTDLDGETLSWANFDLAGDNVPDLLPVGGGLVTLSTTKAATTSGETVYVTGVGFLDSGITSVEISTPTAVFTAGIRAAALITTKTVPATVISDTKLSFVLPKITLPKGVTTLQATIKVVNDEQLRSDPIPLDYIPKKLAQTLTATLPPVTNIIAVGTPLISTATVISSNLTNPPVVTATPSSVCTATINVLNKLVITPVAPGKCSISVVVPGTPAYTVSATKAAIYTVKDYRTLGLNAVADSVTQAGVHTPKTFDMTSGLTNTEVTVVVGENAVEVPVTLNKREGTVLFTVDAASEAASRCVADSGDVTGLVGSITMNDLGTCRVTVTLPADDKYFAGTETFVIVVTAIAYVVDPSVPVPLDIGDATLVPADELAELIDPKDPDDPSTPPVAITLNPDVAADYAFGGEDGLAFDPATKKLNIRSRTPLVGTWTAVLSSPNATKKWFKIPGKIVKKVQTYTYSNICKLTLTVKKDPKLKKKVTRIIGAGCILSSSTDPGFKAGTESGWSALTGIGIQKIKVKYKRTRQYAKTGLSYVKKKGNRVLKNINRTWVIKIGRRP